MNKESSEVEVANRTPIVRRTSNHIYEHCDSVVVLGMQSGAEMKPVIQLSRDTVELMDGSTKGRDLVQATRLTYATVVMERDCAKKLADTLLKLLADYESGAPSPESGEG